MRKLVYFCKKILILFLAILPSAPLFSFFIAPSRASEKMTMTGNASKELLKSNINTFLNRPDRNALTALTVASYGLFFANLFMLKKYPSLLQMNNPFARKSAHIGLSKGVSSSPFAIYAFLNKSSNDSYIDDETHKLLALS